MFELEDDVAHDGIINRVGKVAEMYCDTAPGVLVQFLPARLRQ